MAIEERRREGQRKNFGRYAKKTPVRRNVVLNLETFNRWLADPRRRKAAADFDRMIEQTRVACQRCRRYRPITHETIKTYDDSYPACPGVGMAYWETPMHMTDLTCFETATADNTN